MEEHANRRKNKGIHAKVKYLKIDNL